MEAGSGACWGVETCWGEGRGGGGMKSGMEKERERGGGRVKRKIRN